MWTISSTDVQQARERIDRRRAELEARYANEKEALDTESATIEALERAATEFAQRHKSADPVVAGGPTASDEPTGPGEAAGSALGCDDPAESVIETEPAPASGGEIDPSGYGEANLSFDILKPGSRWRLNRAARLLNPESGSAPTPSSST
ncbi:MAG: hypothetical protein JO081_14230 [Alphaproteobacteria bacterium]|nr:hypothetical protein [Alphaproteobacteria bacterium]